MKKIIALLVLVTITQHLYAQPTFKAGWNNYQTGYIIRDFIYTATYADSFRLFLTDSAVTFATPDSMVTETLNYRLHDNAVYKVINYFTIKKQLAKCEEYKDDNLQQVSEWKYDDKGRKTYYLDDNKVSGNSNKNNYDYTTDKKTGETIATESNYFNGKIRFYTKSYYDKNNVKTKEVRLNDNNKDIIHVESYVYGDNGRVKERSVYFPEFKVTKKYEEREGLVPATCFRVMPMGVSEKINIHTRVSFMKKLLNAKSALIFDKACDDFEYRFQSGSYCEITVASTKVNNTKRVIFRYKEKV